jgi:hypothetical protein
LSTSAVAAAWRRTVVFLFALAAAAAVAASLAAPPAPAQTAPSCEQYPAGIAARDFVAGASAEYRTGRGDFRWLSWSGHASSETLATSLVPPGNPETYRNPDDADDHTPSVGDWLWSLNSVKKTTAVKAALTNLLGRELVLPVWEESRGRNTTAAVRIQSFGAFRLLAFDPGKDSLTLEFLRLVDCTSTNAIPVAQAASASTSEDAAVELDLAGSDGDGDALTFLAAQAAHGTVELLGVPSCAGGACTQRVRYTPAANFNGTDTFTFRVADATSQSAPATATIAVAPVNDAPTAVALPAALLLAEDTAPQPVSLGGADVETAASALRVELVAAPAHGTLRLGGTAVGAGATFTGVPVGLTYQPDLDYFGDDAFRFRVVDAGDGASPALSAELDVPISIASVNDLPTLTVPPVTTAEDTPVTVSFTGADVETPAAALRYAVVSGPAHGTLSGDPNTGQLLYTPAANYTGPDSFRLSVTDGDGATTEATAQITVTPVNEGPVAVDDAAQLDEDATVLVDVLANDVDSDGAGLAIVSATAPGHGAVAIESGRIRYTPAANFFGDDSFSYTI